MARSDFEKRGFPLRPGHAVYLIDLAVIAGLFFLGGRLYMQMRGTEVVAEKEKVRAELMLEGEGFVVQADSVVAATEVRLIQALADSSEGIDDLRDFRQFLERTVAETQGLGMSIYRLSDVVLDMRQKAEGAVSQMRRDRRAVEQRREEVDSLRVTEERTRKKLEEVRAAHDEAGRQLALAQSQEQYDPKGLFPARTGVSVRRDVGDDLELTNVVLQHVVWGKGPTDVGLSVGFGLSGAESASNKEVGLLLSRSLVHRRLGLDLTAGVNQLTDADGEADNNPYAAAGLRVSPFYGERLHIGLGARANPDEVVPFLGLSIGRR